MGVLVIEGSIVGGPPAGGSSFPSAIFTDAIGFTTGGQHSFASATGLLSRSIDSPSSFVALGGIGATSDVAKADFLYLVTDGLFDVQITADDGVGGSTVATVTVNAGPMMLPVDPARLITGVSVKGSGRIQYLACGPV